MNKFNVDLVYQWNLEKERQFVQSVLLTGEYSLWDSYRLNSLGNLYRTIKSTPNLDKLTFKN